MRSQDSTSCFQGVTCIQRTRFPFDSTISLLFRSLIHGGTADPKAGHSLVVRWAYPWIWIVRSLSLNIPFANSVLRKPVRVLTTSITLPFTFKIVETSYRYP